MEQLASIVWRAKCCSVLPDVGSALGRTEAPVQWYRVCIRRVYGGDVKMKCEGLWLDPYLHINDKDNYVLQC